MLKMFWNLMFSSPLPPRPQAHPRLKEARELYACVQFL